MVILHNQKLLVLKKFFQTSDSAFDGFQISVEGKSFGCDCVVFPKRQ